MESEKHLKQTVLPISGTQYHWAVGCCLRTEQGQRIEPFIFFLWPYWFYVIWFSHVLLNHNDFSKPNRKSFLTSSWDNRCYENDFSCAS